MIYIIFLALVTLIIIFVLYQMQFFMVFSPTYYRGDELDDDFELLSVITDDGVELEGVVYEPCELYRKLPTIDSTLLFFGGRGHDSVGLIKRLSKHYPHTRIITFNYRSYGKSKGRLNEKNILNDALKVSEIVKKNYGDFYILGFSIGASVASYVATKVDILGLFLVAPFDSIVLLAERKYGKRLAFFSKYKFNNIEFVKLMDTNSYIFASKNDEVIHIDSTRNLKSYVKNLSLYKEFDYLTHKELLWDKEVVQDINSSIVKHH